MILNSRSVLKPLLQQAVILPYSVIKYLVQGFNDLITVIRSDPDATYREKAGKKHRGYAGNVEESVGINGSVVTEYYENNRDIYDDYDEAYEGFIEDKTARDDNKIDDHWNMLRMIIHEQAMITR